MLEDVGDDSYSLADLQLLTLKKVLLDPRRIVAPMWVLDPCSTTEAWLALEPMLDFNRKELSNTMFYQNNYLWHENNTWCFCGWVEFCAVSTMQLHDRTSKLDHCNLHAQANAEIWNVIFTRIFCGQNFPLNSSVSKTSWNQHTICTLR